MTKCSEKKSIDELLKLQKRSEDRWKAIAAFFIGAFAVAGCLMFPVLVYFTGVTNNITANNMLCANLTSAFVAGLIGYVFAWIYKSG